MIFPQVKMGNVAEVDASPCNAISSEIIKPFMTAIIAIAILAIIFNLLGIYLLKESLLDNSFHYQVLKNLSICDILIIIASLIDMAWKNGCTQDRKIAQVIWSFRESVYHVWLMMFYLLTLNRLFGCNFPFLYRSLTSPNKCKFIIIGTWVIAIILLPIFTMNTVKVKAFSERYLWLIYEGIFLLLFIVTYATVFCRKKKSNQNLRQRHDGPGDQQLFALTATMLIGFLLFQTVPTIGSACLAMVHLEIANAFKHLFLLCWVIHRLIHPIIYVFLMPTVRSTLYSFRVIFRRNRIHSLAPNNAAEDSMPTKIYITQVEELKFQTQNSVSTTIYITKDEEK